MIELKRFMNNTKDELENMELCDIYSLNLWEKVERYLIIEGYTDHDLCRKIVVCDVTKVGYLGVSFTVVSTKKRCRKPSFFQQFYLNEERGEIKLTGYCDKL